MFLLLVKCVSPFTSSNKLVLLVACVIFVVVIVHSEITDGHTKSMDGWCPKVENPVIRMGGGEGKEERNM